MRIQPSVLSHGLFPCLIHSLGKTLPHCAWYGYFFNTFQLNLCIPKVNTSFHSHLLSSCLQLFVTSHRYLIAVSICPFSWSDWPTHHRFVFVLYCLSRGGRWHTRSSGRQSASASVQRSEILSVAALSISPLPHVAAIWHFAVAQREKQKHSWLCCLIPIDLNVYFFHVAWH